VAIEQRLMTAQQLLRLPNDHMRHELVNGELRTMPPTGAEHGGSEFAIAFNVMTALRERPDEGYVVVGDVGFRLTRGPDTVRAADVAFIRFGRLPGGVLPKGYIEGAPDLAVEIVSRGDTAREIREKVGHWLAGGALAVWVVFAVGPSLVTHLPDGTGRRYGPDDEIDGGDALPGFRMRLRDLLRLPPRG
jgi:Uma2 family endonuclease